MIRYVDNDIYLLAGETLPISQNILVNGNPATNLILAKIKLKQDAYTLKKNCTISDSVVSVVLTEAETLLLSGDYDYEIRVKDALGNTRSAVKGIIHVEEGVFDEVIE